MSAPYLISILGPTASGKTGIAVELAKHYNCEIISCDSRQFFKEMSIGTAKPTKEEMQGIPHHFVDHLSIWDQYAAGQFEHDAIAKIAELHTSNKVVILVGGSGMYARAIFNGIDDIPSDPAIRDEWNKIAQEQGIEPLVAKLKELDPQHYSTMDLSNPQRLVRAIEACLASGKPYSELRTGTQVERPFTNIKLCLDWEREALYERINRRVDIMMEQGQLEEARSLYPNKDLNALQTVGYKEFFEHFDGHHDLETAVELLKRNTRRYAKRQLTWFRREEDLHWIEPSLEHIISYLDSKMKNESE